MPDMPEDRGPPPRQIDIRKKDLTERDWISLNGQTVIWLLLFLTFVLIFLGPSELVLPRLWAVFGLIVLLIAARIGWLVFRTGLLTWRRRARAPARALSRGDKPGAERAFAAALARARRFAPHDYRRALMVLELADYLKLLGRSEAKGFFEEAVDILGQQWKTRPQDYFIALNNLAVYLLDLQDFAAAQRILEKVLDLTLFWRKGGIKSNAAAPTAPVIELFLHLNLVVLFMCLEDVALAADHLKEADAIFRKLTKAQNPPADWYRGVRARLLYAQGQLPKAARELDKIQDPDIPMCVSVRAKLSLARGEFAEAEQILRKYLAREGKKGSVHRPGLRGQVLELAESLFAQGKYDEAFDALHEARAITRDFALPPTSAWRKALADWLYRTRQLGRTDDAGQLQADLRSIATVSEQAIIISPRLRIRPPES